MILFPKPDFFIIYETLNIRSMRAHSIDYHTVLFFNPLYSQPY